MCEPLPLAKRISPLEPHVPPRGSGTAQTDCTAPETTSIFRSSPLAKKASCRLSGDQNGSSAFCVPGSSRAAPVSNEWSQSEEGPFSGKRAYASERPSGDNAG
jgi:hypothetical protein